MDNIYKLIIVDDEETIRDGLSDDYLDWEKYGFQLMACAADGNDAWNLVCKYKPDLVITDIRMPLSDGIDLAGRIKEKYPNILIVFLSAYNDFLYAQSAIELGVFRYIIKPVDKATLITLLEEAKNELRSYNINIELNKLLEQQVNENKIILQNNLIRKFILGRINKNEIENMEPLFHLKLLGAYYQVLITTFDDINHKQNDNSELIYDFQLLSLLDKIGKKLIIKNAGVNFCQFGELEIAGLIVLDKEPGNLTIQQIVDSLIKVQSAISRSMGKTISFGLSNIVNDWQILPGALAQARRALEGKMHSGPNSIVFFKDIKEGENQILQAFSEIHDRLEKNIQLNNIKQIKETIGSFIRLIVPGTKRQTMHILASEILTLLTYPLIKAGVSLDPVFGPEASPFSSLYNQQTLSDLQHWLVTIAEKVLKQKEISAGSYTKKNVELAKRFIQEYYADKNLNLSKVADAACLSPCYFCKLFKKTTNQNLADYIMEVRLTEAKRLLKNTLLNIYQVADDVGFADSQYFSSCFKKKFDMTPTEYREGVHFDI